MKKYAVHIGSRNLQGYVTSTWFGIVEANSISEARRFARNKCGSADFVMSVSKKIRIEK